MYLDRSQANAPTHHTPNFPRHRFLLESIRPEIRQYFIESDSESVPFSRAHRSVVYSRAKGTSDTLPFGTRRDLYQVRMYAERA